MKNAKQKNKRGRAKSNLVYNNFFAFNKHRNTDVFVKRSLDSKLNDLKEFKNKLEFLYQNII